MSNTFTPYNEKSHCHSDELPFMDCSESEELHRLRFITMKMEHDLFFLYVFLTSEDICSSACEYLEEHEDDNVPFKMYQ